MAKYRLKAAIFNDTRSCRHFGCTLVMRNLISLLKESEIEPVWFWPVAKDWRRYRQQLPQPGEVDGVIVNGEGTMHHCETRHRPEALADIAEMANDHLNVPAFLVNATLYQNSASFYRKLQSFSRIYVRDSMSLEEIQSFGLHAEKVPDLSLARDIQSKQRIRTRIGATDSVAQRTTNQIKSLCREQGWTFQPMQTAPRPLIGELRQPRNFARKGITYLRDQLGIRKPEEFIRFLQSKQLIVTGRYHTVTMCLLTHTPFLAIESNTPKISALLSDALKSTRRVFQEVSEIPLEQVQSLARWSARESRAVAGFREKTVEACENMIGEIKARMMEVRR